MNFYALTSQQQLQLSKNIEDQIKSKIPKFEIKEKQKSPLMKVLSYVLFFNRKFMTSYITTIYPKVYWNKPIPVVDERSSAWDILKYIDVLCHEGKHLLDRKKSGLIFNLFYLFPQILSLLSLLAIPFSLWFLLFLLFLAPLPSPGRMLIERNAHDVTLAVYFWLGQDWDEGYIDSIVKKFTGPDYYFMWPFRNQLKRHFLLLIDELKAGKVNSNIKEIYDLLLISWPV